MKHPTTLITSQKIHQEILSFIEERLNKNLHYKSEKKRLFQAEQDNDYETINESKEKLAKIEEGYEFDNWMSDTFTRRINWLNSATHLSKGIHPSSGGSNSIYEKQSGKVFDLIINSSCITDLRKDFTGNAAALDIITLLEKKITDEATLSQLIIDKHPSVIPAFSDDLEKAKLYIENIEKLLKSDWKAPHASELNKQFYWPLSPKSHLSMKENSYRLLIPLHPSSLCNGVFHKIQERFSTENKKAIDERYKKKNFAKEYYSYVDLALVKLGGTKPQTVSLLNNKQGGKNFLLPSMPPHVNTPKNFTIKQSDKTLFTSALKAHCREGFEYLFSVMETLSNTKAEREVRKKALDIILANIFQLVKSLQNKHQAGWTRDYQLNMCQKCWLDPKRAEMPQQDEFKRYYESDWLSELEKDFGYWINNVLTKRFKGKANDVNDAEFKEWGREFHSAMKLSVRNNEGIFND